MKVCGAQQDIVTPIGALLLPVLVSVVLLLRLCIPKSLRSFIKRLIEHFDKVLSRWYPLYLPDLHLTALKGAVPSSDKRVNSSRCPAMIVHSKLNVRQQSVPVILL